MKLLASIALLAGLVPAQATLYNLSIPAGVQATVIDWEGKLALCLVNMKGGAMFKVIHPSWLPPSSPRVELTIAGVGVWDFRPCAQGARYGLSPSYEVGQLNCPIPPSGLFIETQWKWWPTLIDGRLLNNNTGWWDFRSVTCPGTVWIRTGTCQDEFPEGACIVATLAIK